MKGVVLHPGLSWNRAAKCGDVVRIVMSDVTDTPTRRGRRLFEGSYLKIYDEVGLES